MNESYAIIDIGSNTIVLVTYNVTETDIQQTEYISNAAHLVSFINHGSMKQEGIDKAHSVVAEYMTICKEKGIHNIAADITECGRGISNSNALIEAISSCGIDNVRLLTGEEEALCDYYGSRLDSGLDTGLMADIGGGSTELVSFTNGQVDQAVSLPLGCVRLSSLPLDPAISLELIELTRKEDSELKDSAEAIGVGGTIKATAKVLDALYHTGDIIETTDLKKLYKGMKKNNPEIIKAVLENVTPDRHGVFYPGLGMLKAIATSFKVRRFYTSQYGVREGFLLHFVLKRV